MFRSYGDSGASIVLGFQCAGRSGRRSSLVVIAGRRVSTSRR